MFGNWVKTSSQMRSHRRRDWTKLFSFQYIEDYWKLSVSATVANSSSHTADTDKTRQDSLVLSVSAVWTRHNQNCGLDVAWSSDGCDGRLAITPSWFLLLTVPLCITTGQIVHTHKYACASRQYNFVLARGQWYSVVERVTVSVVFHWPCVSH